MSSYNLAERMNELLKYTFLEFEITTPTNSDFSISSNSLNSYGYLMKSANSLFYTPPNAATLEDLLDFECLIRSSNSLIEKKKRNTDALFDSFCSSMPDLRRNSKIEQSLLNVNEFDNMIQTNEKSDVQNDEQNVANNKTSHCLEESRLERFCSYLRRFMHIVYDALGKLESK